MTHESPHIKIAVFSPNRPFFGTTITQLPLLYALKQKYPNSQIDIWSRSEVSQLLLQSDCVDNVILFSKTKPTTLAKQLKLSNYHSVYNLHPSSARIHIALKLSGIKTRYALISKSIYQYFYHNSLLENKDQQYIALRFLGLFNHVENERITMNQISFVTKSNVKSSTSNDLTILCGGGAGEYKRWGIENFCLVVKSLFEQKAITDNVNFVLGPDESSYIDKIKKELHNYLPNIKIRQSPTIPELIELAVNSKITLANDCGPAHIFQITKAPMIMMFGTHPDGNSPYNVLAEWFYSHEHSWAIFPDEQSKNIKNISVEKVVTLAQAQLMRNTGNINNHLKKTHETDHHRHLSGHF